MFGLIFQRYVALFVETPSWFPEKFQQQLILKYTAE